jgi:hypothetical protein
VTDNESHLPSTQVLVGQDGLIVWGKGLAGPVCFSLQAEVLRPFNKAITASGWVLEPPSVLLCKENLVLVARPCRPFLYSICASLETPLDGFNIGIRPVFRGLSKVALLRCFFKRREEEVPAFLVGEEVGLIMDI